MFLFVKEENRRPRSTLQDVVEIIATVVDRGLKESDKYLPPLPIVTHNPVKTTPQQRNTAPKVKQQGCRKFSAYQTKIKKKEIIL